MPAISSIVMAVGMAASVGTGIAGQQAAKSDAKKARAAQEKALEEQRVLDAAQQLAAKREEEDIAQIETGGQPLTVGTRAGSKRKVKDAPVTTGLRVG
jgi:hypothetical protein